MDKLSKSDLLLLLEEEKCFNKNDLVEVKNFIASTICKNTFQKYFNKSNMDEKKYYKTTGYRKDLLLVFEKAHKLINQIKK